MTTPDIRRRRPLAPAAEEVGSDTLGDLEPGLDDGDDPGLDDVEGRDPTGAAPDDQAVRRCDGPADGAPDHGAGRPAVDVRRRRRVRSVAAAAVVALVGFLVVSGVEAGSQLGRSTSTFASTRAEQRSTLARLRGTEARLAAVLGQSVAADRTLGSVNAALAAERSQLAQQQQNLFIQGVSISALDTCLGGVESALNEVALNDQPGAVSTLQGVSTSCRTAGASGG